MLQLQSKYQTRKFCFISNRIRSELKNLNQAFYSDPNRNIGQPWKVMPNITKIQKMNFVVKTISFLSAINNIFGKVISDLINGNLWWKFNFPNSHSKPFPCVARSIYQKAQISGDLIVKRVQANAAAIATLFGSLHSDHTKQYIVIPIMRVWLN